MRSEQRLAVAEPLCSCAPAPSLHAGLQKLPSSHTTLSGPHFGLQLTAHAHSADSIARHTQRKLQ